MKDDRKRFDDLCDFLDTHEFSVEDMLAVVCAHLLRYKDKKFNTEMMVGGQLFKIDIKKV